MMPKKILFCLFALSLGFSATAQLPKTNIYLFEVKQNDEGKLGFGNPQLLTNFNRNGYNGDPSFFSNTEIYITAKEPTAIQADLYKLDIVNKTKQRVTETPQSEFAPDRMPEFYNFSAIRVEKEGLDSVYRLWQFPVDQLTNGKPVFKYISGIREYYWINSQEIVIYKEEEPTTLSIVNTNNDNLTTIATGVGNCFTRLPNGNLAYVQKSRLTTGRSWKRTSTAATNKPGPSSRPCPMPNNSPCCPTAPSLWAKAVRSTSTINS